MMRAWIIKTESYDDSVVIAESRSAARWRCVSSMCEVLSYTPRDALRRVISVRRAPGFDRLAADRRMHGPLTVDAARRY